MTSFFIQLYRFFRSHRVLCWLSMVGLFVFFGYFASQIHLEEDINQLMPSSKNEDGTTKLAFADLKIKDKTFLLFSVDSSSVASSDEVAPLLAEVCDAFVDSLMASNQENPVIDNVFYALSEDLMTDGVDYLSAHFPAYIDTSLYVRFDSLLTREHFLQQMQQNKTDLIGDFGSLFPELIQIDPMGMRNVLAEELAPLLSGGSYKTIDSHFFVPDTTVCLAFITPRFSATNTGQGSALFVRLNNLISSFAQTYPNVHIAYHGTPASGFYNASQVKHDLTTTIAAALLLVLVFLMVCFRRWTVLPLLLIPVAFGALFGLSVMYWLKGEFSLLALGIGGVVLGVALSYVLHVLTHHRYVDDIEQLLRDQVKPVLLGCITTIGSFSALLFVKTELLSDFGLFASFAILGTTLFSLVYLPHMLGNDRKSKPFPAFVETVCTYPFDRKKPLLVVMAVVVVVLLGAFMAGGTRFDADMHNLGYDHPLVKGSEDLLRDKTYTGSKTKYFASKGKTMEEAIRNFAVLDHKLDSLQQLGLVESYSHTNQIFVDLQRQQQRIDAWQQYWTADRLLRVKRLIAETAPAAGLDTDTFDPFFEAATAHYEPSALYESGILSPGYLSTMAEQSLDGHFLCFTSVRCQNDSVRSSESDYMRICDAVSSHPDLLVLDTYYYTTDTLLQMNDDFNRLQWLSMVFVLLVLLVSFRFNIGQTLLGFLPILLSWLMVLGAMTLFDQQFNLINIVISTFIFGIGVDYSIFVMHGLAHEQLSYHKTAIFLSAVTLITTVGSMLLAVHPVIRGVGFPTLVGLLSAIVLSYVLQPALWRLLNRKKEGT